MPKRIVVENDPVEGTDTHNISGTATATPTGTTPYMGTGRYDYVGKMTDALSDSVTINGAPVALTSSQSSLNPGEDTAPAGKHFGPQGAALTPPSPPGVAIIPETLTITDTTIGVGTPSASAGSTLVTIGGVPVLLDGDRIDTCDGLSTPMNSTVTAETQDLVSCSQ